MDFCAICETFGNGDCRRGHGVLKALARRLDEARAKHPEFAIGAPQAVGVIGAEYDELEAAMQRESHERQRDEALDVAATALRFILGEHLGGEE